VHDSSIRPLPPNQQLAAASKWPIVGEREPRRSSSPWTLSIGGLVGRPCIWALDELRALPQIEREFDIHCVTRWSKLGMRFGGVRLNDLLGACEHSQKARYISFTARTDRNHSTSLPLVDAAQLDVLVALTYDSRPLDVSHGGPLRTIVPGRYFYKSLKWLEAIELLEEDRLGYWEAEAGYHNRADPWREERFIAANLDRRRVAQLLEKCDASGEELLGLDADGRDLEGFQARGALLRNASFRRANLKRACFDGANLSNAHFEGAALRQATFRAFNGRYADLEGADFRGADLRGADFNGASLFGATFRPENDADAAGFARIDSTTRIESNAIEALTPLQQNFLLMSSVQLRR
jgi:hypothetical protein